MIVTTSLRALSADVELAERLAGEIGADYVARLGRPLAVIQEEFHTSCVIVLEQGQPIVYQEGSRFFFHRGMAELRILNILRTGHDPMIRAMNLAPGMSVLDCTLGLAADALVAAFIVGDAGMVLGLEAAPVIAALTRWGLLAIQSPDSDAREQTRQASRRVQVRQANHQEYLAGLADDSFDVVYFDPMFRRPQTTSCGIQPLRNFADAAPLSPSAIQEARRVAKLRVVVKETQGSREFDRLGIDEFVGGRYSAVQYGILRKEETDWIV